MPSILDALNDKFGTNGENIADSISQITKGSGGEGSGSGSVTPVQPMEKAVFAAYNTSSPNSSEFFPRFFGTTLAEMLERYKLQDYQVARIEEPLTIGENITQDEADTFEQAADFYIEHGYGAIDMCGPVANILSASRTNDDTWSVAFTWALVPELGFLTGTIGTFQISKGFREDTNDVGYSYWFSVSSPVNLNPPGGES